MIRIGLKEVMRAHRARTGSRVTYESLAEATGISLAALQSMGTRTDYNPTIATVERICRALECQPGDLLELVDNGQAPPDEN